MATLFDKTTQETMLNRLNALTASSTRRWGKMSVSQMLKHLEIAFSVPIEKIKVPKEALYYVSANPLTRWLMIDVASKWPKNLVTAASFKVENDPDFESTKQALTQTIQAFLQAKEYNGVHPVFGKMDKEIWEKAMYLHLNHHLEQFGV